MSDTDHNTLSVESERLMDRWRWAIENAADVLVGEDRGAGQQLRLLRESAEAALSGFIAALEGENARLREKMGTLYEALSPEEGVEAQYAAVYLTRWGHADEPQLLFRRYEEQPR